MTINKRLDFIDGPGSRRGSRILFYFCNFGTETIVRILLIAQRSCRRFLITFFKEWHVSLKKNKSFSFGAAPFHDPELGTVNGLLPVRVAAVARSAAVASHW